MKKIISVLSLVLIFTCFTVCVTGCTDNQKIQKQENNYVSIIKINNKYGLKNKNGKIVIAPTYDELYKTSYELIVAIKNNKLGLIDKYGNILINPKYEANLLEYHFEFSDGLAAVIKKEKDDSNNCIYIDKTGKEVLDPTKFGYSTVQDGDYGSCSQFKEGLAPASVLSNFRNYGYINKTGKLVIKLKDVDECGDAMCMSEFDKGIASVNINGKHLYINKKGKVINNKQLE